MMRRPSPQLSIPLPAQRRNVEREPYDFYAAVICLRSRGATVYRNGRDHAVNGARVSARRLVSLARAVE